MHGTGQNRLSSCEPREVAKKGQEKGNNLRFYIRPSFTLIRKVNTVKGSPEKDKKKTTTRAFIFIVHTDQEVNAAEIRIFRER